MSKKIPFVEMPAGSVLDAPLPDGEYATISHRGDTKLVLGYRVANPFPWKTIAFKFDGGEAQELGSGSSPAHELGRRNLLKVILVGLNATQRTELDRLLAQGNIELVPAEAA